MLNQEKVKSMTKAAAYEKGPEKKNIEISSYFRGDYIGLQLVKSGIAYALTYLIILAIWAMVKMEELMLMLSHADYLQNLIKTLILLFIVGLVIYEGAVYAYYSHKYKKAKQSVKGYDSYLRKIHKFYETEGSVDDLEEITDEENSL